MAESITGKLDNIRRLLTLRHNSTHFVPYHEVSSTEEVQLLRDFIEYSKRILVLTGAGISTESGIPDYRSAKVGLYEKRNHKPIQHLEFLRSDAVRKRYWARNFVGWDRFSNCQPNRTHMFVKDLEVVHGKVSVVVTQNVDNLHFKAGSQQVIELHGSSYRVICLNCKHIFQRSYVQKSMEELNANFNVTAEMIRPDGDVDIPQDRINEFSPPYCENCKGILKPDITFFGDNVPRERVDTIRSFMTKSDALLVLGSTLSVFSSYRILLQALEENKRTAIVNIGPTRADNQVKLKISANCGELLSKILST